MSSAGRAFKSCGQFQAAKNHPGERRPHRARPSSPPCRPSPTGRHRRRACHCPSNCAERAADDQATAPAHRRKFRNRARSTRPTPLPTSNPTKAAPSNFSAHQPWISVITHAKHARIDPAADADEHRANRRPPHPVNRQFCKHILTRSKRVAVSKPEPNPAAMPISQRPCNIACQPNECMGRDRKDRPSAQEGNAQNATPQRRPLPPG